MTWWKRLRKKEREYYCPIWRTEDGSEICFEQWNAPTEEECLRKNEEIREEMENLSSLRFTGKIHKVTNQKYHLIQYGDDLDSVAFVLSGPMLDKILALPFHPDVDDGVIQPLAREAQ